jgi:transmembrane sensor
MSDVAERVHALREHVDAEYDGNRTEAALLGLRAECRRRHARRVALAATMGVAIVFGGTMLALRARHGGAPARLGALFALDDGSVVMPIEPSSRVLAKTVSAQRVELELVSGSARFDVVPNREREFRVRAGRVDVVVVGTRFSVERQGERTAVVVEGGRVRVEWERGQQVLEPGERGSFPPFETTVLPPSRATESPVVAPDAPPIEPRAAPVRLGTDWRVLANRGEFAAAYRKLRDPSKSVTPTHLDDLLLAADVARRSGHAAEAVPYLEKGLTAHPGDARSAVVAFTLGRVYLTDLHDPTGAAAAFARARAAAPHGPLAEDALAREIEARSRSGDQLRAHALAEEYVQTWPAGTHLVAVRHFGGLP